MQSLRDAVVGKYYIVKKNQWFWSFEKKDNGHGNYKKLEIYIRKVAPLGDPVKINIRHYELSIRKGDAELIAIEEIEKKED